MTEEVAGEIAELKRDFDNLDDEIAVRASATRLRRYATLRSKVELYETALSSGAATLKNELMKNPRLYRSARPESSREAPERFDMAPLGRTQSERRRRLALASGFRLFRSFGIDRIGEPGHAAGRGRAGPDG